jgi:hypothetical protein
MEWSVSKFMVMFIDIHNPEIYVSLFLKLQNFTSPWPVNVHNLVSPGNKIITFSVKYLWFCWPTVEQELICLSLSSKVSFRIILSVRTVFRTVFRARCSAHGVPRTVFRARCSAHSVPHGVPHTVFRTVFHINSKASPPERCLLCATHCWLTPLICSY